MLKVGRPRKYMEVIEQLNPDKLYSPSSIARLAIKKHRKEQTGPEEDRQDQRRYTRVRIALGRWSNNHPFPDKGDGTVRLKGKAACRGWFGWRWQEG